METKSETNPENKGLPAVERKPGKPPWRVHSGVLGVYTNLVNKNGVVIEIDENSGKIIRRPKRSPK